MSGMRLGRSSVDTGSGLPPNTTLIPPNPFLLIFVLPDSIATRICSPIIQESSYTIQHRASSGGQVPSGGDLACPRVEEGRRVTLTDVTAFQPETVAHCDAKTQPALSGMSTGCYAITVGRPPQPRLRSCSSPGTAARTHIPVRTRRHSRTPFPGGRNP